MKFILFDQNTLIVLSEILTKISKSRDVLPLNYISEILFLSGSSILAVTIHSLEDILRNLCSPQNSSAPPSTVSWIALFVSLCSLGVTIFNSIRTLKDKKFENVINNITDFMSLFGKNMDNQKWQLLKSGNYISNEHRKLETKILGYLKNEGKDKPLREAVLQLRNEKPSDEDKLASLVNNVENKLKEWRND